MHGLKALHSNTCASIRLHKRSFVFFVVLMLIVVSLVFACNGIQNIIAARESGDFYSIGSGSTTGLYSFKTYTNESPTPRPTCSPSVASSQPPIIRPLGEGEGPLEVLPEFGEFGGIIALLTCFVAFTLFMKYKKTNKTRTKII